MAQDSENVFNTLFNDNITIHQEYRINKLINDHIKINKKQDGSEGYRIRIFSAKGNNAKSKAIFAKTEFIKKYPFTESYLDYKSPNFSVVIGDFRTKSRAEQYRRKIEKDFPEGFIIKDIISFPKN